MNQDSYNKIVKLYCDNKWVNTKAIWLAFKSDNNLSQTKYLL